MHIALIGAFPVSVHRLDSSGPRVAKKRGQPVPDAMAEFCTEEPAAAPVKPVTVLPVPPIRESRRANLAPVPRAVSVSSTSSRFSRNSVRSFVWGAVCGVLLCLIAVYWLATTL